MAVYQSSILGEDESKQIADFEKILDIVVDPAIELCTAEHAEKRRLRPTWDYPVFVLNSLTYLQVGKFLIYFIPHQISKLHQGILEPFSFTKEKQTHIDGLIDSKVSEIIEEQVRSIITLFHTSISNIR
jgi:conserved oligomeric Golgi complex subunit 6